MSLPDPLTPPDCDLRDFAFMPIDIVRLFGSEFHALASDAAWRVGVTLWLRAWHQVPAGSLPNDDVALCRLAELGRDLRTFRKTRADALRGWKLASDGRLYHAVVAEKANEAWDRKLRQRHRTFCATIRKHNERHKPEEIAAPSYEEWLEFGRPEKVAGLVCRVSDAPHVTQNNSVTSHATNGNVACDIGSKGQGQGQGQGQYYKPKPSPTESKSSPKPEPRARAPVELPYGVDEWTGALAFEYVCREADWRAANDTQRQNGISIIDGWLALGCSVELILDGITAARKRDPSPTRSLKRFDSTIRGRRRDQLGGDLPVIPTDVQAITNGAAKRMAATG